MPVGFPSPRAPWYLDYALIPIRRCLDVSVDPWRTRVLGSCSATIPVNLCHRMRDGSAAKEHRQAMMGASMLVGAPSL